MRAMVMARATATTWLMVMAMRLAGDKKAREGCKGNCNGNVRVAGDKEGKGSKEIAMARQEGWQASGVQLQQRG